MNAVQLEHPPGPMLTAYGLGQLSEEELAGIDNHLASCQVCRQVVEGVVPDTLLSLLRSAATEHASLTFYDGKVQHGYALSGVPTPQRCPRCQAGTRQHYANFIYATQAAPRVMRGAPIRIWRPEERMDRR